MPNITTYTDNETYIGFLRLSEVKRKELRDSFVKEIQTELEEQKIKRR